MEVVILPSADAVGEEGARIIGSTLAKNPRAVLGLATGRTQHRLYAGLVARHRDGLSFREVTTFNLDEIVGSTAFRDELQAHLFGHLDLQPGRAHVLDGLAADLPRTCAEYEQAIRF